MRLLGIGGSPRRGGNTDLLLAEVLRGASRGAEVKTIILSDLNIAPCQHCDDCLKTGDCTTRDDMQLVYRELEAADRLVLASPLYFMGVTAQLKAMIDRCQALWARRYVLKTLPDSKKKGVFIGVGATKGKQLFDGSILTIKYFFQAFGVEYSDELLVRGVDKRGEIKEHPDMLAEAFELGKRLAQYIG
ncbi:MAG: flavodoxin family protein [Dehalococcoidales bacterium]|nr:flavodoxin family protein [Dehalococcoidales bacterium]